MSQPSYNSYQDDQQRPPPAGYNPGGGPPPVMPPPAYGADGQPPDQAPPMFPPPEHHTMSIYPNQPFAGYNPGGGPPPAMPPPTYGADGQPPDQAPPMFPPPEHHTMGGYPNQPNMAPHHDQDYEANLIKPATLQFDDKSVRAGFIRKVFGLLTVMLLFVFGMVTLFCLDAVFLVTNICIICCESVRRKFPGNLICLFALALSLGYMTAMISAYYENLDSIFLAMGICAACSFTIILFSCQTKYAFTSCMSVAFVLTMILLLFGIFATFYTVIFKNPIAYVVYASLGALVFMVYLAIDTQMLMGGKRYEYSPEDYIVAAVQLFVDLFLDLLYIFTTIFLEIFGWGNESWKTKKS